MGTGARSRTARLRRGQSWRLVLADVNLSHVNGRSSRIVDRSRRPMAKRRIVVGYSQEGLAEVLGVDRSTVSRWERGTQVPQPWQRPALAGKLGVSLEQLDGLLTSLRDARVQQMSKQSV